MRYPSKTKSMSSPRKTDEQLIEELVFFEELFTTLQHRLALGEGDNCGVEFRINREAKWAETIGLRFKRVRFTAVSRYLSGIISDLAAAQRTSVFEHASISKSYRLLRVSGNSVSDPHCKTLYITLRPSPELFDILYKKYPKAVYKQLKVLVQTLKDQQES